MKIQIDIPKELHKFVQIEKIKRERNTLAETILEILEEYSLNYNEDKNGGKN